LGGEKPSCKKISGRRARQSGVNVGGLVGGEGGQKVVEVGKVGSGGDWSRTSCANQMAKTEKVGGDGGEMTTL